VGRNHIHLRVAEPNDTEAILDVCSSALGWVDPTFDRALFRWKHFDNAFGPSTILVAEDSSGLLAVRPLMQWRFTRVSQDANGVTTLKAARAVDTATRPGAQGKGLFRKLTEMGLEELEKQDFGFVFNTPNDQSRPGYLKMGWATAGQVRFGFGVRSLTRLPNILRSRTSADKPSIETSGLGIPVAEGLSTIGPQEGLASPILAASEQPGQLQTAHTFDTLLWRFAQGPIEYRWIPTNPGEGCIVRLRQRGASRELVVALAMVQSMGPAWSAVSKAMHHVDADYCLTPAGFGKTRTIQRLGPTLALRSLGVTPTKESFNWSPGDIELF